MQKIILHDTRLDGRVEPGPYQVIQVDATTSLATGFRSVVQAVRSSPAELVIACHGYTTHQYGQASHQESTGGSGLQLCRELLLLRNLSAASALRDTFRTIWVMACGAGGNAVHDSRPFGREFAHYANSVVVAADRNQIYNPGVYDSSQRESRRALRFGAWEGTVYEFRPDGTVRTLRSPSTPLP